ncbi:metal ABC transporter permease [Alphaproteobacteria bacterium]|nr:metal ABC transporter permease [Alphaproteobacteria bacterium]
MTIFSQRANMLSFSALILLLPLTFLGVMGSTLGCFIIWQRLTFVGESLAHGALFGIGLSLFWQLPPQPLYIGLSTILSLAFGWWSLHPTLSQTWQAHLNSFSHGLLGLGLLLLSFFPQGLAQAETLLFGDILALSAPDAITLSLFYGFGVALLILMLKPLIQLQIAPTLVHVEGKRHRLITLLFFTLLGAFIGVSVPLIGVFLLMGTMLLPSAAAQLHARSPRVMIFLSQGLSLLGVTCGYMTSHTYDLPMAPAIVSSYLGVYLLSTLFKKIRS